MGGVLADKTFEMTEYYEVAKYVYRKTMEMNAQGDPFCSLGYLSRLPNDLEGSGGQLYCHVERLCGDAPSNDARQHDDVRQR